MECDDRFLLTPLVRNSYQFPLVLPSGLAVHSREGGCVDPGVIVDNFCDAMLEISLLGFLVQENYTTGFNSLSRTFAVAGLVVSIDAFLKAICVFGFAFQCSMMVVKPLAQQSGAYGSSRDYWLLEFMASFYSFITQNGEKSSHQGRHFIGMLL
ncbi:hypothetical protein Ancab_038812 [Ancistrocladus abbreviatus]